jgi:uncharacterized protein (DUF433 family)
VQKASEKPRHPYVVTRRDYCAGAPIIKGTKFPVRSVVTYVLQQGCLPQDLVKEFPYLSLAQVYDALPYYYAHQEDIERELGEDTEEKLRPERIR